VLRFNGEYYLYTSGDPITAFHSTDLVHWDAIGPVLSSSKDAKAWNQADVWAPEVAYRNGKFYMYYTASLKSEDWRVGEMGRRIGVAVSDSPRGPFVDSGAPVTPGWGIDGDVFRDPNTGTEYLFYSYLYEPRLPGAGIVADKMTAWNSVAGMPAHITRGSEAWEDKDGDPNNGSLRYTNEGPTILKHHGRYFMFYSGGSWDLPTYSLAYAWSEKVLPEGGLEGRGWNKVVPPLVRSTPLVDAPGHNTIVKAPNGVDDINLYHARKIPFLEPWNRLPFADRIYWLHDRPFAMQPSLGDMPPPDRPLYELTASSKVHGLDEARGLPKFRYFISELNLALVPAQPAEVREAKRTGSAPFSEVGETFFRQDAQNWVTVALQKDKLYLVGKIQGKPVDDHAVALPPDFNPQALHQLVVTRNGGRFSISLDGVQRITALFPVEEIGNSAADIGASAASSLSGATLKQGYFAFTPYYDDTFDTPDFADSWQKASGTWLVEEGALHQVAGGPDRNIALKGDATDRYEFTASMKLRDTDANSGKVGIVAAATGTGSGEIITAGFDHTIWPFARLWIKRTGGEVAAQDVVSLPRGFQYDQYHTIRVVRQGSAFTFFLDGAEIAAERYDITGPSRPGLFTEGARAAFDDASLKWTVVPQNLLLNGSFETEQWDASHATPGNPWRLSGSAREHYCCAHSGLRRLLFQAGGGEAQQLVPGLAPGKYRLDAFVLTSGGGKLQIAAATGDGPEASSVASSESWKKPSLDFVVPEGKQSATIILRGLVAKDSNDFAVVDDVYLYRLP